MWNMRCITQVYTAWMTAVMIAVTVVCTSDTNLPNKFFRAGPHSDMIVLNVPINTYGKYSLIVIYCVINSAMRSIKLGVLQAWLINDVQNDKPISPALVWQSYEVSVINCLYSWFDWFISINLLLSQIDIMMIEVVSDTITTIITNKIYIANKKQQRNYELLADEL